ncbi:MAG: cupin domain-containing protein [Candidatus Eremiobacteraeota bacterium]|nr:cupin domain-containing protein [Candidatus Eremiobacteraeota bacterium]
MQATIVDGVFMWSAWQPERNLFFNSFFLAHQDGNLAVDPLPLSEADAADIERRGGVAWIVVTNRDHERAARAVAERFGAKIAASAVDAPLMSGPVDRALADGDTICGVAAIALDGLKTAGEIALNVIGKHTVIVGDALWGDPAGSLRLMPDEKLGDPARGALSLRRLAAALPENVLVGDGTCIFGGARSVLWACLEARTGVYVNKANPDELKWSRREAEGQHTSYASDVLDIDFAIGAEKLGYRLVRVDPGKGFCPLHWHAAEEELFIVTEGEPTLVTRRGNWKLRKGDFVNFPTRLSGAHKIVNESNACCELIMISNLEPVEVCGYPDSRKVLLDPIGLMVRDHPDLEYLDGE